MNELHLDRRRRFLDAMGPGVAVLSAAREKVFAHDVHYPFRQDTDFLYLTGFPEPEAYMVLLNGEKGAKLHLFVRPRDRDKEIWNGRRAGVEGAKARYGADEAYPLGELSQRLPDLLDGHPRLFYGVGRSRAADDIVFQALNHLRALVRKGKSAPKEIHDPAALLGEMRLLKTADDIERQRAACALTAQGHRRGIESVRPGMREYELAAEIEHVFQRGGARCGYPSIVGGGENGCILHYTENSAVLSAGQLVLVDAGAELDGYTGDVTRTYPVDGRFSPPQRDLYQIVLEAQERALARARPGQAFDSVHRAALETLVDGLLQLGLLQGTREEALAGEEEKEPYRRFYMHRTSHWLGMEVHDAGAYLVGGKSRELRPGMILTVEPGLYVSPDDTEAPAAFRGIGIRIEDDVLITPEGHEVLTAAIPK